MPSDPKRELLELDDPLALEDGAGVASGPQPAGSDRGPDTIVPTFDPRTLAEQSEVRHRAPTITDEVALERARLASMVTSQAPPARGRADSLVEVEAGEEELDGLGVDEQIAVLTERLSPLHRVPELAKPIAQLGDLLEDPKAAYVAGFVDGLLPLETILEVTGLPVLDTLRVLDRMITQGIVVVRASRA